jgi:hypothetical protein
LQKKWPQTGNICYAMTIWMGNCHEGCTNRSNLMRDSQPPTENWSPKFIHILVQGDQATTIVSRK